MVLSDTAKRQLRSYVTVDGVIRTKDPGDLKGEGFAVLIDVKNSGQGYPMGMFKTDGEGNLAT
ncbi:hypothetical protein SAMN05443248_3385 [Bradyrhizobium erythrophlei]|uniref:Uncharacterized protein n=1 Tax=Bradyrhizobium erythrophlei TaxID=1437360 RepID=A0A1M5PIN2_9BRAD|nr:hypothetical protein SAMN05443248_3385 [Bradyrhizobium erythrophlei]